MNGHRIYIQGAAQISTQNPLSEDWIQHPVVSDELFVRSQDPNFRDWLSPLESRRMGLLMKRALVTAMKVIRDTGVSCPDAIITGTGLGCIENTERFLEQLCREGEQMLKPTYFMQSTHNTVSSLIAIHCGCHGYNTTYSHRGTSFDAALMDAVTQLHLGDITTALVTGNDELTPSYFRILQRAGYLGQLGQVAAAGASMAMMLTTTADGALCEVESVGVGTLDQLPAVDDVDGMVLGTNGLADNDAVYEAIARQKPDAFRFDYKRLFGEGYSASALGLYAAAHLVAQGKARRMLFVNHGDGRNVTYVILRRVS